MRVRFIGAVCLGLLGCRASPSDGPSVSGESHFLALCGGSADCAAGLVCLCGMCTAACEADDACGEVETGAVCTEAGWSNAHCGEGGRICDRTCRADADCGDGLRCADGLCAAPEPTPTDPRRLGRLEVTLGGGPCLPNVDGECWWKMGLRGPDTLVLEDSTGVVEATLTAAEVATVEDITRSPGFEFLLTHPDDCHPVTDSFAQMSFQWQGEELVEVPSLNACDTSQETVGALLGALQELWREHMPCPPFDPRQEAFPQRALCVFCNGECTRAEMPCTGVAVDRGGVEYCAGPDTNAWPCPDASPARTTYRGVAVCGPPPGLATEAEAEAIAIEALQTGRILALGHIDDLQLPATATHHPGVAPRTPVELVVVVAYPGGAWFTPDGAPVNCDVRFAFNEIEETADGFRIAVWNRVTCGPPTGSIYVTEPHASTLVAPAAGRYPLRARGLDADTAGPVLLVGQDAACPANAPDLAACGNGYLFAECGGDLPPSIFCIDDGFSCRWFTGGCPAAGFTLPVECEGQAECPSYGMGWGPEPWDRDRDMVLPLTVDTSFVAPPQAEVQCQCENVPCFTEHRGLCNEALATGYEDFRPEAVDPAAPLDGLVVIGLYATGPELGLGEDWVWVLEADAARAEGPRARICLFQTSDALNGGPPVCAESGEVVFDREVRTRGDAAAVHGHATAVFTHVPRNASDTITVTAEF